MTNWFQILPTLTKGRKEDEWSEAPSVDCEQLPSSTLDKICDLDFHVAPMSLGAPVESHKLYEGLRFFVLEFPNGETYLVDTEGYDYARYILRLENFPVGMGSAAR